MDKQSGHKATCELPSLDSEHGQKTRIWIQEIADNQNREYQLARFVQYQGSSPRLPAPGLSPAFRRITCPSTIRLHENHEEKSGRNPFACC